MCYLSYCFPSHYSSPTSAYQMRVFPCVLHTRDVRNGVGGGCACTIFDFGRFCFAIRSFAILATGRFESGHSAKSEEGTFSAITRLVFKPSGILALTTYLTQQHPHVLNVTTVQLCKTSCRGKGGTGIRVLVIVTKPADEVRATVSLVDLLYAKTKLKFLQWQQSSTTK